MAVTIHPNEDKGLACYVCDATDVGPVINDEDLPHPYDWMCLTCLASKANDGSLTLVMGEALSNCTNCGDVLDNAFCQGCYDSAYENGREEAYNTCDECGDDSVVYCRSCAPDQFGFVDLDEMAECSVCNNVDDTTLICKDCKDKTLVATAAAAEPIDIEVAWD